MLDTTSAIIAPAREAKPGDVVYERNENGYVLVGLVLTAGTMEDVPGRYKAQIAYMHFSPVDMDASGVNGRVYGWQHAYHLIGVNLCGYSQEAYTLWSPNPEVK